MTYREKNTVIGLFLLFSALVTVLGLLLYLFGWGVTLVVIVGLFASALVRIGFCFLEEGV